MVVHPKLIPSKGGINFPYVSAKQKVLAYCFKTISSTTINQFNRIINIGLRKSWALLFGKVMILLITVAVKIETCSLAIKIVIN